MKKLLTELQHILNNLKDKNEIAIVKKYSCIAKRYTITLTGGIITVGTGTIFITYIQHTCGMFRIASYRIEHAMSFNILQNITLKKEILMTNGIIYAVNMHRQAMKLTMSLLSVVDVMIACLIACGIICISINLFCVCF
ncbi:PREDICTED: uncharacterized protein LOC105565796 [Vollenhovia emeryi]|uniref:uncharacterized protein LOC105565796 n=1 Tax=Vollenhovia emeryi TaxID=411798 RepID=UPI0005F57F64|nr:PREDICTED: uncharacterized protein LOC105565796 [Vollenhovia emeryi]